LVPTPRPATGGTQKMPYRISRNFRKESGGLLSVVIMLVGSFKMRAQLRRRIHEESKSEQHRS